MSTIMIFVYTIDEGKNQEGNGENCIRPVDGNLDSNLGEIK